MRYLKLLRTKVKVPLAALPSASAVLVEAEQSAAGTEARQQLAAMAAAAERHVGIGAVGTDVQSFDAFLEQYRDVICCA